jgi:hypothetical protein
MTLTPQQIAELTADEIVRAIQLGGLDDSLRSIEFALKRRKTAAVKSFRPGQRVKLVKVSPKYLVGLEGTVQGARRTRVDVVFDYVEGRNYGKFESQMRMKMAVGVTPDMVEVL